MEFQSGTSPMTQRQLVDTYFIENRTKLLDLAAFLDRLERASDGSAEHDFRLEALREGLRVLCDSGPSRVEQIQMILSDPTTQPLETLDQKSACGAYDRNQLSGDAEVQ